MLTWTRVLTVQQAAPYKL